mmetsp:Transcript_29823/g.54634  ORF Transcript_29823/g.54634 Transcript_29823/m.54634 type:complete len:318 (+) Transcript_29823:1174-2127(+)
MEPTGRAGGDVGVMRRTSGTSRDRAVILGCTSVEAIGTADWATIVILGESRRSTIDGSNLLAGAGGVGGSSGIRSTYRAARESTRGTGSGTILLLVILWLLLLLLLLLLLRADTGITMEAMSRCRATRWSRTGTVSRTTTVLRTGHRNRNGANILSTIWLLLLLHRAISRLARSGRDGTSRLLAGNILSRSPLRRIASSNRLWNPLRRCSVSGSRARSTLGSSNRSRLRSWGTRRSTDFSLLCKPILVLLGMSQMSNSRRLRINRLLKGPLRRELNKTRANHVWVVYFDSQKVYTLLDCLRNPHFLAVSNVWVEYGI